MGDFKKLNFFTARKRLFYLIQWGAGGNAQHSQPCNRLGSKAKVSNKNIPWPHFIFSVNLPPVIFH